MVPLFHSDFSGGCCSFELYQPWLSGAGRLHDYDYDYYYDDYYYYYYYYYYHY